MPEYWSKERRKRSSKKWPGVFLEQIIEVLLLRKEELVPGLEFLTVRADYAYSYIGRPLAKACEAARVELIFFVSGGRSPESLSLGDSNNEEDKD